jgi:catechol-2,3-dioxygenase
MATQTQVQDLTVEDVGNIMLLEHVNVQVDDQSTATLFYLVGLGFTRDPHMMVGLENMWVNLGEQQFHLPTGTPNVLRGHVGIVTPSLDALAQRLESVAARLEGTQFSWSRKKDHIEATSPWGNVYKVYEPAPEHGPIMTGMPYVEFTVPTGTADGIAAFYREIIGCAATVTKAKAGRAAEVEIGQYQRLIFRESKEVADYDGHHIAVYVSNFSRPYELLKERGLITEEPRNHQYRFVDIIDPKTGEKLFQIEHEVRGLKHAMYRRDLVNRQVGQFLEPRRMNGQTVLGSVM